MWTSKKGRPIGTKAMVIWHECLQTLIWFHRDHARTIAWKTAWPQSGFQLRVQGWTSSISACWSFHAVRVAGVTSPHHEDALTSHVTFLEWAEFNSRNRNRLIRAEFLKATISTIDIITCGSMHEYGTALIHAYNQDKLCLLLQRRNVYLGSTVEQRRSK